VVIPAVLSAKQQREMSFAALIWWPEATSHTNHKPRFGELRGLWHAAVHDLVLERSSGHAGEVGKVVERCAQSGLYKETAERAQNRSAPGQDKPDDEVWNGNTGGDNSKAAKAVTAGNSSSLNEAVNDGLKGYSCGCDSKAVEMISPEDSGRHQSEAADKAEKGTPFGHHRPDDAVRNGKTCDHGSQAAKAVVRGTTASLEGAQSGVFEGSLCSCDSKAVDLTAAEDSGRHQSAGCIKPKCTPVHAATRGEPGPACWVGKEPRHLDRRGGVRPGVTTARHVLRKLRWATLGPPYGVFLLAQAIYFIHEVNSHVSECSQPFIEMWLLQ
jgi:hypothetical protein